MLIAKRDLTRIRPRNKVSPVTVSFGAAQQRVDASTAAEAWSCTFQIVGLDITITRTVEGSDSLEAIHRAMILAGIVLEHFAKTADPLIWDGLPGLGFPAFNEEEYLKDQRYLEYARKRAKAEHYQPRRPKPSP